MNKNMNNRRYAIDSSKIKKGLNWSPSVSFEQGIASTIKWYIENKRWMDSVISNDYRNYYKNMYGSM